MATVVAIHQPPQNSDKVGVQNDLLLHSFLSSQACVHILDFLPWESIHKVMQVVHLAECSASKIAVVSSMEPSWTLPCWAAVKSEKIQTTTAIPLAKTAGTCSRAIEVAPNVRLFLPTMGFDCNSDPITDQKIIGRCCTQGSCSMDERHGCNLHFVSCCAGAMFCCDKCEVSRNEHAR